MTALSQRDLLSIADLNQAEVEELLQMATQLKSQKLKLRCNKVLGLLFSKASNGAVQFKNIEISNISKDQVVNTWPLERVLEWLSLN